MGRVHEAQHSNVLPLRPRHARGRRVLDLELVRGLARPVGVVAELRHDAFQSELAGVLEDELTVACDELVVRTKGLALVCASVIGMSLLGLLTGRLLGANAQTT